MRKIVYTILGLLLLSLGYYFFYPRFNADKILANSILKEKEFQGETVEISALNGKLKAYLMEEHSLPIVSVSFGFDKAGSAYENKEGITLLTKSLLLDGAGRYSRQELRRLMKEKGIHLAIGATTDRLTFSLSYIKMFEKEALEVLKAVMYEPLLADVDIKLTRQQLSVARNRQKENPNYHLNHLIDTTFYGNHPYGKDDIPDEKTLALITSLDIRSHLKAVMGKDNLKIGIAGDMNNDEAKAFLKEVFKDLNDKAQITELAKFTPLFETEKTTVEVPFSAQNFIIALGSGIKRLDKDFYPLYIADYIFGGSGLNSRLNKAVREKEGLTYGIYSYFTNSDAVDLWHIYFSTTPDNASKAQEIVALEYQRLLKKGITAEELNQAKLGLLSSYNLRFSDLSTIASVLEQMQVKNLGIDFLKKRQSYIKEITLDDVNRAIKEKMPKALRLFEAKGKMK